MELDIDKSVNTVFVVCITTTYSEKTLKFTNCSKEKLDKCLKFTYILTIVRAVER